VSADESTAGPFGTARLSGFTCCGETHDCHSEERSDEESLLFLTIIPDGFQ